MEVGEEGDCIPIATPAVTNTENDQGMTITFFPTCPVGQVDEFSTCPSGKTSCPCQILKINYFD